MGDALVKEKSEKEEFMTSATEREMRMRAIIHNKNQESIGYNTSRKEDEDYSRERKGSKFKNKNNDQNIEDHNKKMSLDIDKNLEKGSRNQELNSTKNQNTISFDDSSIDKSIDSDKQYNNKNKENLL